MVVAVAVAAGVVVLGVALTTGTLTSVVLSGLCVLLNTTVLVALMALVSRHAGALQSATPAVALLLEMALTGVYLLVLLFFFRGYRMHGSHTSRAITRAMKVSALGIALATAGFVALCAGAVLFFRGALLWHFVVVAVAAVLPALSVLTFVPALVALSGSVFSLHGLVPCVRACRGAETLPEEDEAEITRIRSSFLVFLFSWVARKDWHSSLVTMVTVAVMSIFIVQTAHVHLLRDRSEWMASSAHAVQQLGEMQALGFPTSIVAPFVLFHTTANESNILKDAATFRRNSVFLQRVLGMYSFIPTRNVVSLTYLRERHFAWDLASELMKPSSPQGETQLGVSYRALAGHLVDANRTHTVSILLPNEDPGDAAATIVPSLSRLAARTGSENGDSYAVLGLARDEHDHYRACLAHLGWASLVGLALALVAAALLARAPAAPVAFFAVTALTVATAAGITVLVYPSGVSVLALLLVFPVVIGISFAGNALFYAFVTRFRLSGFSPESSVLRAVYVTRIFWPTTLAIETLCFAALLFSTVPAVRELAVFFCVHAAVDYVLGKLVLAPSITLLWCNYNWWPKHHLIIYRKAAVANHGSRIIRYIVDSDEAREEEEDDERDYQEQMQRERDQYRQEEQELLLTRQQQQQQRAQQGATSINSTDDDFDPMDMVDTLHETSPALGFSMEEND